MTRSNSYRGIVTACAVLSIGAGSLWAQEEQSRRQERRERQDRQSQQTDGDAQREAKDNSQEQESADRRRDDRSEERDDSRAGLGVFIVDSRSGGVEIERVVEGSPAADAGLRQGDRILRVNGRSVNSPQELSQMIARRDPGTQVQLVVLRNGERRNLQTRLESREEALPDRAQRSERNYRPQRQARLQDQSDTDRRDGLDRWRDQRDDRQRDSQEGRLTRLERVVDRLAQQIDRLQGRIDGRTSSGRDFRLRSDRDNRGYDDRFDNDDFPEERYDADFNRSFRPGQR